MTRHTFTIDEADVFIYPVDENGVADTADPLWVGEGAKNIRISEEMVEVIDRPSGVEYGIAHHVDDIHIIRIGKLFECNIPIVAAGAGQSFSQGDGMEFTQGDGGAMTQGGGAAVMPSPETIALGLVNNPNNARTFRMRRNQNYVMVILWQDQRDEGKYYHRCYYGVTDRTHELGGDVESHIDDQRVFRAQYYI